MGRSESEELGKVVSAVWYLLHRLDGPQESGGVELGTMFNLELKAAIISATSCGSRLK